MRTRTRLRYQDADTRAREAWLYENPKALASVRRGLDQARKGKIAKIPPDLKEAAKLAATLLD